MTDESCARLQRAELSLERRFPGGVLRLSFGRHSWVMDLVLGSELASEAVDELLVPCFMDASAAALNEEYLLHAYRRPTFFNNAFTSSRNSAAPNGFVRQGRVVVFKNCSMSAVNAPPLMNTTRSLSSGEMRAKRS